jgi:hypothetical protein
LGQKVNLFLLMYSTTMSSLESFGLHKVMFYIFQIWNIELLGNYVSIEIFSKATGRPTSAVRPGAESDPSLAHLNNVGPPPI